MPNHVRTFTFLLLCSLSSVNIIYYLLYLSSYSYKNRSIFACYSLKTHLCECLYQAAKRHSIPLGLNADWLHQHPHVLSRVAMDACCLPAFLPTRPSAGQGGTARREWTPLHDVSEVKTRTKKKTGKVLKDIQCTSENSGLSKSFKIGGKMLTSRISTVSDSDLSK